jgi:hypothetical protein
LELLKKHEEELEGLGEEGMEERRRLQQEHSPYSHGTVMVTRSLIYTA